VHPSGPSGQALCVTNNNSNSIQSNNNVIEMIPRNNKKRRSPDEDIKNHESKKLGRDVNVVPPKNVIHTAWEHYRSYLESAAAAAEGSEEEQEEAGDEGMQPDVDELYEIVELLEQYVHAHTLDTSLEFLKSCCACSSSAKNNMLYFPNVESLLPVFLSMVYLHLGDHAISQGFDENMQESDEKQHGQNEQQSMRDVEDYLHKSLSYFPLNAAALSMLANYQRMNMTASLEEICCAYDIAAKNARIVRDNGIAILAQEEQEEEMHGTDDSMLLKEWVELLLLDGITGSEYVGEIDEDENEEDVSDGDGDSDRDGNLDEEIVHDNAKEEEEFSMSTVEATCSFMAGLLHSTLNHHSEALCHLSKFDITHRIHPNIWIAGTDKLSSSAVKRSITNDNIPFQPIYFTGDGVLPDHLYSRLCTVFSPSAMYWKETDYQNRGYFSFYEDICKGKSPKNLVDDVILNYLLPLAQSVVPSEKIVGYEFWTHTRPLRANLGHQMHFDTDEALLAQEKKVTHPVVSSILYLTGNKEENRRMAGSTIILNQTPSSSDIATEAYISHAQNRKYTIFPGCCLHGVLPCPGSIEQYSNKVSKGTSTERLTLMVGFWTRRVPDQMLERRLYGPCSPLPEPNEEHTWVQEIMKGYGNDNSQQDVIPKYTGQVNSDVLPTVSPAWEDISGDINSRKGAKLQIPTALDHRFFVKNASSCFKETLFKNETF